MNIRQLFSRNKLPKTEHPTELAFTIAGTDYFCFADAMDAPYERALAVLPYYEELRMKCDKEFLVTHTEAVDAILNDPKGIKVGQLALLNRQMQERLQWIAEPDIMYKLASVIFFDRSENPYIYDYKYAQKKISVWKQNKETHAFFLQKGVRQLIPFMSDAPVNFQIYLESLKKVQLTHLENLLSILSEKGKLTGSARGLQLRAETLRDSTNRVD